jgi:molybdate transport system regulatory protein
MLCRDRGALRDGPPDRRRHVVFDGRSRKFDLFVSMRDLIGKVLPLFGVTRQPQHRAVMSKDLPRSAHVLVEIRFPNGGYFGPGDLALIDAIRAARSIIGASRALGVSYRKCWLGVDALNRTFESPVVATHPGRRGGGAEITAFGERLVALYRSIERHTDASARPSLDELTGSLDWSFDSKAKLAAAGRDPA